jgi:hypothetical protein
MQEEKFDRSPPYGGEAVQFHFLIGRVVPTLLASGTFWVRSKGLIHAQLTCRHLAENSEDHVVISDDFKISPIAGGHSNLIAGPITKVATQICIMSQFSTTRREKLVDFSASFLISRWIQKICPNFRALP